MKTEDASQNSAVRNLQSAIRLVGRLGFAPSSRRLRAGTSLSKCATLVPVRKDGDGKAQLNRRSQACADNRFSLPTLQRHINIR